MTQIPLYKDRNRKYEDVAYIAGNHYMAYDLARMFMGVKLGEGAYRSVYDFSEIIPNSVIKICDSSCDPNLLECHIWMQVKGTPHAKWFAPVLHCSPAGHYLIQKKVKPLPAIYKLPKQVPQLFTDLKTENWGLLNGKLVCHDYQMILRAVDYAMCAKRTADWNGIVISKNKK